MSKIMPIPYCHNIIKYYCTKCSCKYSFELGLIMELLLGQLYPPSLHLFCSPTYISSLWPAPAVLWGTAPHHVSGSYLANSLQTAQGSTQTSQLCHLQNKQDTSKRK